MKIKDKLIRKMYHTICGLMHTINKLPKTTDTGIITIYHDYERQYHHPEVQSFSDFGIKHILAIEKHHQVKTTFNIVAKLLQDVKPIVDDIKAGGHDIASHSFVHSIYWDLNRDQIKSDIEKSIALFRTHDMRLSGLRSPQSKWRFSQMQLMLKNGLKWSAENDKSQWPYVIYRIGKQVLVRLPIAMDDWGFEEKQISPNTMYNLIVKCVDKIAENKSYGAIGFHPWVLGKEIERIKMFNDVIDFICKRNDIKILTFSNSYNRIITNVKVS